MGLWQELDLENKITQILSEIPDAASDHHFGTPFLTAYQIAIEFKKRYPDDAARLDLPVGGTDTGQRNSLSQYIARELSRNINAGNLSHIEGGFLSNQHLKDILFVNGKDEIRSSLTTTNFTLSMFKIRS